MTEEVISQTKNDGMIGSLIDVEDAAKAIAKICNMYNSIDIDFTVLLTHIGFEEDKKLASLLDKSLGVDIIIGGHSHTLLEEPCIVNDILIVQAGTGTNQIGRFDIVVDTDNNCIDSYEWQIVPIDNDHCSVDRRIMKLIYSYKNETDQKYQRVVTRLARELTHPNRNQETELGNLLADAVYRSLNVNIAMFGSGAIRSEQLGPIVMYQDLKECLPYDDPIYMLEVTGDEFMRMVKYMVRDEVWQGEHCEFYQFSKGVEIVYNRTTKEFEKFEYQKEPIDKEKLYSISLAKFHYTNFDEFFHVSLETIEARKKARIVSTSTNDIIEEYLSENLHLNANDSVIGLAASGRTPYVIGGLDYAKSIGAYTASVSCVSDSEVSLHCETAVEVIAGPEVITGSTRMKAGTAEKMICNMISTGCMIHYGKVFENLMVDVQPTNEKLVVRAKNIIAEAVHCDAKEAEELFEASGKNVKIAILMGKGKCNKSMAEKNLAQCNGNVHHAIVHTMEKAK